MEAATPDEVTPFETAGSGENSFDILAVVFSRVAMFLVLFWAALAFDKESIGKGLVLIYGVSTVLYLATWAASHRKRKASPVGFLLYFQFLVELVVEGAIFYSNDGYHSDYGLLFILTILSAGFFFRYWGAIVTATAAATIFGYIGLIHLGLPSIIESTLPQLNLETVQVRFFLYTTLFYMVALLSSLLAGRLQVARQALEGAHKAMDLYQFSAETVMNGLPTGLLFFDAEGFLKFKNGLCEAWLNRTLEPGMGMFSVLQGVFPSATLEEMRRLKDKFPYTELEAKMGSGQPLLLQIKTLIREGQYMGWVVLMIDLTEERRMGRALLRSERMAGLGTMAAKVAHEIRNPLASISGSAQLLRDASFKNESDLKLLGLIVTESARLDRILSGLLDYSRDSRPAYREVSIREIFSKITFMLEKSPSYDKALVNTSHFIENEDIRFISDQDILVQVLLNVALNALQALHKGKGKLEFTANKMGKNVVLKVKDNGQGMNPQEAARAFEPFFTSKAAGTGLGLSTCQHYVQSLDGNITLESEKESGTVVTITLPIAAPKLD